MASRSIDNAAFVIAVCRSCSVVYTLKELGIPLVRDASGKYYLLDSVLFKVVRQAAKNKLMQILLLQY
jgi:hypothetical protein